jgi:hypothetical protein
VLTTLQSKILCVTEFYQQGNDPAGQVESSPEILLVYKVLAAGLIDCTAEKLCNVSAFNGYSTYCHESSIA